MSSGAALFIADAANPDALARAARLGWALVGLLAFALAGLAALTLLRRAARRHQNRDLSPAHPARAGHAVDPWAESARRISPPPPPRISAGDDEDSGDEPPEPHAPREFS